ncbi:OmpA family protein [Accumulibacter sp.]|mgnify:FL=1|jgi:OOP family OmpA-OmpF porin|uniref:OmpA/MotB domain protein n=2 Tax=Candidatus Accumulibacter TaxID=327159 RepID=C7RQS0_ACCRE|nr:OmpA family protein [Accumulibacter sp.]MBN8497335.1 OmpA family protein [Accumulibacter sp.]
MNRIARNSMMAVFAATVGFGASLAQAQTSAPLDRVYVIDQRGEVVMSGAGLCWRTGFWTPAGAARDPAGCKCDKDLIPKEVCEPMVAKAAPAAAPAAKPSGDKITVAADALFDFNKATLRPAGKAKLDEVVAKAGAIKLEVIIAVGHTDRIGSDAYNQKLSERRAAAVKQYLVSKGIDANRVYTEGKGKKNPVTKPDQCLGKTSPKVIACLQPDRRVDIELIGTK